MEGRRENFTPRGLLHPQGSKFAPSSEVKNGHPGSRPVCVPTEREECVNEEVVLPMETVEIQCEEEPAEECHEVSRPLVWLNTPMGFNTYLLGPKLLFSIFQLTILGEISQFVK
jgi:hypothetical protein